MACLILLLLQPRAFFYKAKARCYNAFRYNRGRCIVVQYFLLHYTRGVRSDSQYEKFYELN